MGKIKDFAERLATKARSAKFAVGAMAASAAVPVISVVASAEDTNSSGLAEYSSQITGIFTGMVDQVMPIAVGVLTAGATVFGLFIAWKLARKALGSVTR